MLPCPPLHPDPAGSAEAGVPGGLLGTERNRERRKGQANAARGPPTPDTAGQGIHYQCLPCDSRASICRQRGPERLAELPKVKSKRWRSQGENPRPGWLQRSFLMLLCFRAQLPGTATSKPLLDAILRPRERSGAQGHRNRWQSQTELLPLTVPHPLARSPQAILLWIPLFHPRRTRAPRAGPSPAPSAPSTVTAPQGHLRDKPKVRR